MLQVKQEIKVQRGNCTVQEFDEFFWHYEQQAELMISHFFNGKPYIFICDLFLGQANKVADREHAQFAAIGTGAQTAEYILGRLNIPQVDFTTHATNIMVTAQYVIEEVKRVDTYCGGTMTIGFVHSTNEAAVVPPNPNFDRDARIIKEFEKDFSKEWTRKMELIIAAFIKASRETPIASAKK